MARVVDVEHGLDQGRVRGGSSNAAGDNTSSDRSVVGNTDERVGF